MGGNWSAAPADWVSTVNKKRDDNVAKMAPKLMSNASPMDYHGALGALRTIIKERPDAILVNEGANTLDLARGVIDMYKPRKRLDVGTWGVMGIGMGYSIAAAVETGKPVLAIEGDSAFGFSGMEIETICRYQLPVCIVIFNNDGIYRGTDVNAGGSDPASRLLALIRRPPVQGWEIATVKFRNRTIDLLEHGWFPITAATLVSHLSLYLVLLVCLWDMGVSNAEVNWAEVLAVFAFARLATAIPFTPGGAGVVEAVLITGLTAAGGFKPEVVAAVLVYRALTWGLPILVGICCLLWWRKQSLTALESDTASSTGAARP